MNILAQIISGGQEGVDVASLRAAKALGVPTGGTMAKGWVSHSGSHPEYAELYGMVECSSRGYAARTLENVRAADFTLRIARWFNSPGEVCTLNAIKRVHCAVYEERYQDIMVFPTTHGCGGFLSTDISETIRVLVTRLSKLRDVLGRPLVLNVAGNSERTAPGIGEVAERFARGLLEECGR